MGKRFAARGALGLVHMYVCMGLGLDTTYEDANHQISVDKQDQEPNKYYEHKYYEYCSDEMSDTGADAFTVSVERLTAHAAQRADRDADVATYTCLGVP